MHIKQVIYGLAIPAVCSAAAIPQEWDENSSDIVGGTTAASGDFPFIVSMQKSGSHICGGSLLNANTVVTAAHCATGQNAANIKIRAGSLTRTSGGVLVQVSSIAIHPNYRSSGQDWDVAILKLSSSIATSSTIGYASLPASGNDPAAGTTLTVAGWGTTSEGGSSSTTLRKVDVPVISRTSCNSAYGGEVTTNMFCAGLANGGKDSCQGDSGGPIVTSSKTLVGLVSWGNGCARPNYPGVYARVGTLLPFIQSNL